MISFLSYREVLAISVYSKIQKHALNIYAPSTSDDGESLQLLKEGSLCPMFIAIKRSGKSYQKPSSSINKLQLVESLSENKYAFL